MSDYQAMTIKDAESAYQAILELVKKYPDYPATLKPSNTTILWGNTADGNCIGLFPLQGAVYLKRYINGDYVGLLPFEVVYKTTVTTNKAIISAQTLITELCSWLETCDIDFEDAHLELTSIERTTTAFPVTVTEKYTELAINMQLKYRYTH